MFLFVNIWFYKKKKVTLPYKQYVLGIIGKIRKMFQTFLFEKNKSSSNLFGNNSLFHVYISNSL